MLGLQDIQYILDNRNRRNESSAANGAIAGVLVGATAGVVAGMLLAPTSGTETRAKLKQKMQAEVDTTKDKVNDAVDASKDKVNDVVDTTKDKVSSVVDTTKTAVDESKRAARNTSNKAGS